MQKTSNPRTPKKGSPNPIKLSIFRHTCATWCFRYQISPRKKNPNNFPSTRNPKSPTNLRQHNKPADQLNENWWLLSDQRSAVRFGNRFARAPSMNGITWVKAGQNALRREVHPPPYQIGAQIKVDSIFPPSPFWKVWRKILCTSPSDRPSRGCFYCAS